MGYGLNWHDVARQANWLYQFVRMVRLESLCSPCFPFDPRAAMWRSLQVHGFQSLSGTGTVDLITYTVPNNCCWLILHTAIQSQPDANSDSSLGNAPFDYGDFRAETSVNPYGNLSSATQGQWRTATGGILMPNTQSFALQGQQHIIIVPGGTTAILRINPLLSGAQGPVRFFADAWGFLVPESVGNVFQAIATLWPGSEGSTPVAATIPYFWGGSIQISQASVSTRVAGTALNRTFVFPFVLESNITIATITVSPSALGAAGSAFSVGLYNSSKNLLVDSGLISSPYAGTPITVTLGTPVLITPGLYYLCDTGTGPAVSPTIAINLVNESARTMYDAVSALTTGVDPTPTVGGALNATIGVPVPVAGVAGDKHVLALFQA